MPQKIKEDDFDEPFANILKDIPTSGRLLYEGLQQNHGSSSFRSRHLKIEILDSEEVNACTFAMGNADVIEINLGLIQQLIGTMYGLFSLPTFVTDIGNASAEFDFKGSKSGFSACPLKPKDLAFPKYQSFRLPNDPVRQVAGFLFGRIGD